MVGRFIGAYLLRVMSPGKVLAGAATSVIALLTVAGAASGATSAWALLAIGLFSAIMFPTIFSLASEGLGRRPRRLRDPLRSDRRRSDRAAADRARGRHHGPAGSVHRAGDLLRRDPRVR